MTNAEKRTMPPVGTGTLAAYSLGAVSTGIKIKIVETFLLIFYNQAVGLSPAAISTLILVSTIFDAVSDPLIGWYSDRLRSPLGRRHPLMYGSALPLAVAFFLLWNPPRGMGAPAIYVWMIVNYLIVRFGYTLYENSSKALAPEMVTDYDRRTALVSMRILFRTLAGLGATVLAYQYFLKAEPDGSGGVTDRQGYFAFALFCSTITLIVILVSARATQWMVPWLSKPEGKAGSPLRAFGEMFSMMRNRSALTIFGVGMLTQISSGVRNGLDLYFGLYFWGFSQKQLSGIATLAAVGTFAGAALAPYLSRRLGKRQGAVTAFAFSIVLAGLPILLRLAGLMPANGTTALFVILAADTFVTALLYITTAVLLNSMLADVTDELAVATGRRSEGLLFAADGFFTKAVSGVGVMIAGGVLGAIAFPAHASGATIPPDTLWWLGALYVPIVSSVNVAAIVLICLFRIDRARHEQNLRTLADSFRAEEETADLQRTPSIIA